MRSKTLRTLGAIAAVTGLLSFGAAHAQEKTVTFAHQDMLVPLRLVMESGEVEKATGYKINWRMFSGGGDVIRAMASGDVQMGEVGSSPLTAAASQGQDIKAFWVSADIADAEALVARNGSGVNSLKDLKGKRVGYVRATTSHYYLSKQLAEAGLSFNDIQAINLSPADGLSAFDRGDLDAWAIYGYNGQLARLRYGARVLKTGLGYLSGNFPIYANPRAVDDPLRHAAISDYLQRLQIGRAHV